MLPDLRRCACALLAPILLSAALLDPAEARVSPRQQPPSRAASVTPVQPLAGARVAEPDARFLLDLGPEARDVRIVVARSRFDPSNWQSLPSGPAWSVLRYAGEPIAIATLGLADPTETALWWAAVWTEADGGRLRASEVRSFTLVPRFSNRAAADGTVRPVTSGRLTTAPRASRRPIELAAGVTLDPSASLASRPSPARLGDEHTPGGTRARSAWIVQFADGSPDSARARIAAAGGTLAATLGGDGFLVRLDEPSLARLAGAGGEPWVAPYEPAHRLSPAFADSAGGRADVTALLFEDGDEVASADALRVLGASEVTSHRSPRNRLLRFRLDRSRLAEAAAIPDLAWLEPTPEFRFTNDQAQWVVQSGVQDQRPVTAHGLRGQRQIVMTSDSGIRSNHEMFNDSTLAIDTWGDYPEHRKIIAYRPGSSSPLTSFGDEVQFDYHGTHTAGTVAGDPSATSAARWSGIAPEARLYFMDLAGPDFSGLILPADLNQLYQPSYDGNSGGAARISSNSWGGYSQSAYTLSSMQTDQFVWDHPDYLVAFASGNYGTFASVNSPATAKNVLTVGATGNGSLQDKLAPFSSRGPTKDGRRKPTVMAPGQLVTSSVGSTRYTYASYSGTSMATPAVAGAMALARQYLTEGWYPTGAPVASNAFEPSAALLRAMAVAAARNDVTSFRAPDNTIGYGRLTLDDVLHFPGDALRTLLVDSPDGLEDRRYVEYEVQVSDPSQPLKVALCWSDAPGNPAAKSILVNDLDLLVSHDGVTWLGNALLNNISAPGGTRDTLNVEEFVRLPTPAAGLYTIRVEAPRVVFGPQRFALCVTGGVGGPNGAVALDRFDYGLTDTLEVEVIDTDAGASVQVDISSSTEPGGESLTLTGANGVYRARFPLAAVQALSSDGVLAVSTGDEVRVRYAGPDPAIPVAATARVRAQAPVLSDVHVQVLGGTSALVTWTTDLSADSRVHFGTGPGLGMKSDSSGFILRHSVLLQGLEPATTYRYDVESATLAGDSSRDSLGGAHRSFTTRPRGALAVVMDDPDPTVLATWTNALAALGWDADILPPAASDPPLVGNASAGLRSYQAVLWQVDPNQYPPFSDAQRAAVDSLLDGGGRLLVTGHDIGFGLSDAGAPSYSVEREQWLERSLKSRYYADNIYADTLVGVPGSPVSGAYADSLYLTWWLYPDSGDNFGPSPQTDGIWSPDWTENSLRFHHLGMHWESLEPRGTPGQGVWGGDRTRLVGLFYEWCAVQGASTANLTRRTGVLRDATAWLLGHRPPEVRIRQPLPGATVAADFLPIWFSLRPDEAHSIVRREMEYSMDGGESWAPMTQVVWADSACFWNIPEELAGQSVPNTRTLRLRMRVTDDGSPALSAEHVLPGTVALARPGGDTRGPVLVAGSLDCQPQPLRLDRPSTLVATFSDAETGGGNIVAAEYSVGPGAAPPGQGLSLSGTFGSSTVRASAPLLTSAFAPGTVRLWVRALDSAGNWSAASSIESAVTAPGTLAVEEAVRVDFLRTPSPNPFRGRLAVSFGLAQAGETRLEVFDVAGRCVRTLARGVLAPGPHHAEWDARDHGGHALGAGIYFIRLRTPAHTFHTRVVALP